MSGFGYKDVTYSDKKERDEQAPNGQSIAHNEGENSHHASDHGNLQDDGSDIDEYIHFDTDIEKHHHDRTKWSGIQKARTYQKKERGAKSESQKKLKAHTKGSGKRKRNEEAPAPEPTAETPKDGEIHFDTTGAMWYTYLKNGIYISGKYREDRIVKYILMTRIRTRYLPPLDPPGPEPR